VLLVVVVGAVLTVGGILELSRVLGIRRHGLRTEGTVVDVEERIEGSGVGEEAPTRTLASYPVVEFTTAEGGTIRFASRLSLPIAIEVGKAVPVRYRSDDPERAVIDTFMRTWAVPVTLLLGGPTALTIGILQL
jgi:Protein of unknown function (DUF3592)